MNVRFLATGESKDLASADFFRRHGPRRAACAQSHVASALKHASDEVLLPSDDAIRTSGDQAREKSGDPWITRRRHRGPRRPA
jgi:hypothetical protein